MSFANTAVSDIIATTIQSRTGKVADLVTSNNALLTRLKQRGNIRTVSGGNVILEEIAFAENVNAAWYSGYETLPTNPSDVISAAQFDFKQAAVAVSISGLEMLQNSGKEAMIDLMEARVNVAESTMANLIAAGIYADGTGNGGKEIVGLKAAVSTSPTSGTYGSIDRANFTVWRNQALIASGASVNNAATTKSNVQHAFNLAMASITRGSDKCDLIVVDNNYWNFILESMQAIQRLTDSGLAKAGFASVNYMGADVVLDGGIGGNMPASQAFFLNTSYIRLRPHRDRNFVPLDPSKRYSVNQDAAVQLLAWAGNLTCNGPKFQAVLTES
jgi:hypothetical protein